MKTLAALLFAGSVWAWCMAGSSVVLTAQVPAYDWYPSFRAWMQNEVPIAQRGAETVADLYRQKLKTEGGAEDEITRASRCCQRS